MGRTALLPMASAYGPPITFSDEDWKQFEKQTHWTFPPSLRQQVQKAWQEYVDEAFFSEPLSGAESRVDKVKKALEDALPVLRQELTGGRDATIFARHLINKHLPTSPPARCDAVDGPPQEPGDFFKSMFPNDLALGHVNDNSVCSIVQSLVRACERAEMELKELRAQRKAEGNKASPDLMAWEKLIRRLANLLGASGFRAKARHDGGESPFVTLVWEMQACVPLRFRRATISLCALSQQISRVLRGMQPAKQRRHSMDGAAATPTPRQRNRVDLREPSRST